MTGRVKALMVGLACCATTATAQTPARIGMTAQIPAPATPLQARPQARDTASVGPVLR